MSMFPRASSMVTSSSSCGVMLAIQSFSSMNTILVGRFAGDFPGVLAALGNGELYLSVHTTANPGGEIHGPIGARSLFR